MSASSVNSTPSYIVIVKDYSDEHPKSIDSVKVPNPFSSNHEFKYRDMMHYLNYEYGLKNHKYGIVHPRHDPHHRHYPIVVCKSKEEYDVLMKGIWEKFPVCEFLDFGPTCVPTYIINKFHLSEKSQFEASRQVRHMGEPEIVNIHCSNNSGESEDAEELAEKGDFEEALRTQMRFSSRWVMMPYPNLIITQNNPESDAFYEILKVFTPESLEIDKTSELLLNTPVYFPTFCRLKNEKKLAYPQFNHRLFTHLESIEYAFVSAKLPFSEESMCVFGLDNPFIQFTSATPEQQDKALSFVTHGISDMIDYSRGAYLSGSMIAATIQYIRNGNLHDLESNYPRVYTELITANLKKRPDVLNSESVPIKDMLRHSLIAFNLNRGWVNLNLSFEMASKYLKAKFVFAESFSLPIDDETLLEYKMKNVNLDMLIAIHRLMTSYKSLVFHFQFRPGCDIDVPVDSTNPNNVMNVAVDLFTKMSMKWPGCYLDIQTKNRKAPMYRIVTRSMRDRFNGFRDVEIYPSSHPPSQIATYHVNAVRVWKGSKPGIYATISAIIGHTNMLTTHYHYFAGKSEPWDVIDKYSTRGFRCGIFRYNELRKYLNGFEYVDMPSNVGLIGQYNILAHTFGFHPCHASSNVPRLIFDMDKYEHCDLFKLSTPGYSTPSISGVNSHTKNSDDYDEDTLAKKDLQVNLDELN